MKRPAVVPTHDVSADTPALAPAWQVGLSVVLLVHLCAVFIAPFSLAAQGSPVTRPIAYVLRPYMNLLYLNHGYFFFAPNPGPNHLVRYELEFADGRKSEAGEFPDRRDQWPRLLYHRHFMLAESLNNLYEPASPAPQPRLPDNASRQLRREFQREKAAWEEAHTAWRQRREVYEALRNSIANHVQATTGASEVTLIRREHRPLLPLEYSEDRLRLTDPETYRNLPEVSQAEVLPWNPAPSR